jgi:hypothetical protein
LVDVSLIRSSNNLTTQFAFSASVPILCCQLKRTLQDIRFFCRNIHDKDTNNAVIKVFFSCLFSFTLIWLLGFHFYCSLFFRQYNRSFRLWWIRYGKSSLNIKRSRYLWFVKRLLIWYISIIQLFVFMNISSKNGTFLRVSHVWFVKNITCV